MAGVREFGRPSLFITMTTNPKWKEISAALAPGEKPEDRPDICMRVFRLKLVRRGDMETDGGTSEGDERQIMRERES